ncbi:hypothetical protein BDK92_7085 [Micromonospora pisi]|uniref:Uncharacterized protein n=1 Tax=Micromonospora pisi TaxID=589240 RepID=A0A495JUI3_9ACTN|nr:hypothetical protein [Micromonospora pisi]RKR92643.1 hypothetical protein BDK92_7085 [Micromonospora pisi]
MSVHRLVEVRCNGPANADLGCPDDAAWTGVSVAEVRERMRTDGWLCAGPGGIDRCPGCRKTTLPQLTDPKE